jgi:hypothetical protein
MWTGWVRVGIWVRVLVSPPTHTQPIIVKMFYVNAHDLLHALIKRSSMIKTTSNTKETIIWLVYSTSIDLIFIFIWNIFCISLTVDEVQNIVNTLVRTISVELFYDKRRCFS